MMNMEFKRALPAPEDVISLYPLSKEAALKKEQNDTAIRAVFTGESDKLILVIGPCSADREDSVLEYIHRLRKVQDQVADKIIIIPRIYTNKPRTTGVGYKGMLHQSDPLSSPDMLKGLHAIRHLHVKALEETGFSGADEMLYPENHRYLADVLSYVAVSARSVENQQHRLTASGLDMPVGMKNPTSGDLSVMVNAITAAQHRHVFSYGGWEVESKGNPLTHAVLRGYVNRHGQTMPNYHFEDLMHLLELYEKGGIQSAGVVIDTDHSNSSKKWAEQPRIAKEIIQSAKHSSDIFKMVKGLMIESYLEDGCQKAEEGVFGKSITDPCLGWDKTERLIFDLADMR